MVFLKSFRLGRWAAIAFAVAGAFAGMFSGTCSDFFDH